MLSFINKVFDFFVCLVFFPEGVRIVPFIFSGGLHSISEKFFLFFMTKDISVEGDILEIGSYKGGSAVLLALGNVLSARRSRIFLVEPNPLPDRERFMARLKDLGLSEDIALVQKRSQDITDEIPSIFRFIFIDGDHTYDQVITDLEISSHRLVRGGLIAIHDYDREGVIKAVDTFMKRRKDFAPLGLFTSIYYAIKVDQSDRKVIEPNVSIRLRKLQVLRRKLLDLENMFSRKGKVES